MTAAVEALHALGETALALVSAAATSGRHRTTCECACSACALLERPATTGGSRVVHTLAHPPTPGADATPEAALFFWGLLGWLVPTLLLLEPADRLPPSADVSPAESLSSGSSSSSNLSASSGGDGSDGGSQNKHPLLAAMLTVEA